MVCFEARERIAFRTRCMWVPSRKGCLSVTPATCQRASIRRTYSWVRLSTTFETCSPRVATRIGQSRRPAHAVGVRPSFRSASTPRRCGATDANEIRAFIVTRCWVRAPVETEQRGAGHAQRRDCPKAWHPRNLAIATASSRA